jgi:hypothetical protein
MSYLITLYYVMTYGCVQVVEKVVRVDRPVEKVREDGGLCCA